MVRKFVYSPLSFHYKYIVNHSTVSHLVRVKDQIKHYKSIEDLSFNFIFCDYHMRPLLQHTYNTLHGDPDQGLQLQEKKAYTYIITVLFYKNSTLHASAMVGYSIFQTVVNISY